MPQPAPIPTHLDWLLELPGHLRPNPQNDPNSRSLLAFRLALGDTHRPNHLQPGSTLVLDQLDNHRALYLFHQGPLPPAPTDTPRGPARGSVTRLATGEIHWKSLSESHLEFIARWPISEHNGHRVHEYAANLTRETLDNDQAQALPPGVLARFVLVTHKP